MTSDLPSKSFVMQEVYLLEYLPPYSQDYNLIEEAFAELKAWIKRNQTLTENFASFNQFFRIQMQV